MMFIMFKTYSISLCLVRGVDLDSMHIIIMYSREALHVVNTEFYYYNKGGYSHFEVLLQCHQQDKCDDCKD